MSIEERAANLRDKFNFLVKQYKKIEKKKASGKESSVKEAEEIKNELALFFKDYGNFIRSRKNSFGTFDIESYISYLRAMGSGGYRRYDITSSRDVGRDANISSSRDIGRDNISSRDNIITRENIHTRENIMTRDINNFNVMPKDYSTVKTTPLAKGYNLNRPKEYNILNLSKSAGHKATFTPVEDKTYNELYKPEFKKEMPLSKSEGYSYSFKNVLNTPYNQEMYNKMTPLSETPPTLKSQDDFIRSNRIEYTRPNQPQGNPVRGHYNAQGMRQYHTDFINGYYKPEHTSPLSPSTPAPSSLSPSFNTQRGNFPRPTTNGFYEQYVNKKLTVYDFIKDSDKNKFEDMPFSEDKKLYRSTTVQQNVTVLPQINTIYNNPNLYSQTPQINRQAFVNNKMHFSPEFTRPPLPPWKNHFNLQGRTPHQPIRSNTFNSLQPKEKPKKSTCLEPKRKKEVTKTIKREIVQFSPPPVSSSTSEDYQKYFLEDLLRETGKSTSLPQATSSFLYELCDNFFEHMMVMTCALASNGKRKKIDFKDVKLMLKTEFDLELPEETNVRIN